MFRAWQRVLLVYVPSTAYLGVAGAAWLLSDRFPDPVASHFTDGVPDAFMPLAQLVLVALLPPVLTWLFLVVLVRSRMPGSVGRRMGSGLIIGQTFLYSTATVLGVIYANLDAATWADAYSPTSHPLITTVMGVIGFAIGAAVVDPWTAPEPTPLPSPETRADQDEDPPDAENVGDRRRLWVGHARNRFLLWYSAAGLVLFMVVLPWNVWTVTGAVYTLLTLHVAGGIMATFDGETLKVYGFPPLVPLRRIPLSRIEIAEVVELDPLAWGGWGWRLFSLRRHAFVVRSGKSLLVALHGGSELVVTVSDASTGAAFIRQALRRLSAADRSPREAHIPLEQSQD
jgi:hypothetical protein